MAKKEVEKGVQEPKDESVATLEDPEINFEAEFPEPPPVVLAKSKTQMLQALEVTVGDIAIPVVLDTDLGPETSCFEMADGGSEYRQRDDWKRHINAYRVVRVRLGVENWGRLRKEQGFDE